MNLNKFAAVTLAVLLGTAALPGIVIAQDHGHDTDGGAMQGMDHGAPTNGDQAQSQGGHDTHGADAAGSPATEAYRAANIAMHEAMDIEFTDDADVDFAHGMIGHHQGAIDMARIVLEHGKDPELRQLAEEVIAAQEDEIAFLRQWITENAK